MADSIKWNNAERITTQDYTCGYCGSSVATDRGYSGLIESWTRATPQGWREDIYVALCPRCDLPTFKTREGQLPAPRFGEDVDDLPEDVHALYREARDSFKADAFTGAGMLARKVLMNVAVSKGAEPGLKFIQYVDYVVSEGIVTRDMKEWVDEIRELGNDANHEIELLTRDEAEAVLTFVAMLLKVVYEYPAKGRRSVAARQGKAQ